MDNIRRTHTEHDAKRERERGKTIIRIRTIYIYFLNASFEHSKHNSRARSLWAESMGVQVRTHAILERSEYIYVRISVIIILYESKTNPDSINPISGK